jgi:hypothetical protein
VGPEEENAETCYNVEEVEEEEDGNVSELDASEWVTDLAVSCEGEESCDDGRGDEECPRDRTWRIELNVINS